MPYFYSYREFFLSLKIKNLLCVSQVLLQLQEYYHKRGYSHFPKDIEIIFPHNLNHSMQDEDNEKDSLMSFLSVQNAHQSHCNLYPYDKDVIFY